MMWNMSPLLRCFCHSFVKHQSRSMSVSTKPAWCSKLPRQAYASLERLDFSAQRWFQVYRIRPDVFAIYEPYHWEESISYLVRGSHHALMIDSGMGIGNIRQVIDPLFSPSTSLKLINTHTHHDHIGDNWRFAGTILGVRSKFAQNNARGSYEEAQNELQPGMIWEDYLPEHFDRQKYRIHPFHVNQYVQEGDRIHLGNDQELQIIATPGHSPDSISLFDEKNRLLFAGDVIYPGPILLYRPETNVNDFLQSLEKLAALSNKIDLVLPGHNIPNVSPTFLTRAAEAMYKVLHGQVVGKSTDNPQHCEFQFGEFSFVIDRSFL